LLIGWIAPARRSADAEESNDMERYGSIAYVILPAHRLMPMAMVVGHAVLTVTEIVVVARFLGIVLGSAVVVGASATGLTGVARRVPARIEVLFAA
jgi:hypothetical protein